MGSARNCTGLQLSEPLSFPNSSRPWPLEPEKGPLGASHASFSSLHTLIDFPVPAQDSTLLLSSGEGELQPRAGRGSGKPPA